MGIGPADWYKRLRPGWGDRYNRLQRGHPLLQVALETVTVPDAVEMQPVARLPQHHQCT